VQPHFFQQSSRFSISTETDSAWVRTLKMGQADWGKSQASHMKREVCDNIFEKPKRQNFKLFKVIEIMFVVPGPFIVDY
jgi:hypothetical protein